MNSILFTFVICPALFGSGRSYLSDVEGKQDLEHSDPVLEVYVLTVP